MKKIFVTGSAGFIGFHLCRSLLQSGHQVVGYDSMNSYYDPALKEARLGELCSRSGYRHVTASLEDVARLRSELEEFRPSHIVHLAAQAGVRYSIENPEVYLSSNVIGSHNLLASLEGLGVEHVLLASTSSAYGANEDLPFRETAPTATPVSLYAATKIAMEALAHSRSALDGVPITAFRFFTVYGPWGRPDMALYKFVSAIEDGREIDVYGEGDMQRDFTYVDDLVEAITRLLDVIPRVASSVSERDTVSSVAPYRLVNIGAGSPTGLRDFISAVEGAVGISAQQRLLPMQPGDMVATFADNGLLRDLVGDIQFTPIGQGVRSFVDWYRAYRVAAAAREADL